MNYKIIHMLYRKADIMKIFYLRSMTLKPLLQKKKSTPSKIQKQWL